MTTIPMMPSRPVGPVPARVEEGLPDGEQPPGQEQQVERQERAQDLRRDGPGGEPGRRLGLDDEQRDATSTISDGTRNRAARRRRRLKRLAEAREHCRQAGRGEAATVGGSGVGPDPAGLHAG